jgi:hypothetical protein
MIEGRVAQILNERELVINRGRQHGVVIGMQFAVLAVDAVNVVDPETGESLGALDRPKVRVQVTEVQEKFSICETFELVEVAGNIISPADFFRPTRILPATLRARQTLPPLTEEESIVKIGDRVRQWREPRVLERREASG